jgi:hypothetical protein
MAQGLWGAIALVAAVGCGQHSRPVPAVESRVFHPVDPAEIVQQAEFPPELSAIPQTPLPARIAVWALDEGLAQEVADSLEGLQGVADTYIVRGYLLDGRPRWSSPYPGYAYSPYYRPPQPIDLEKLRSVAAMAHCDVLILADHAYQQHMRANGWTVFTPLLLPMLFVPFLHTTDHSYLDLHVIDVRTGYLYGQVSSEQKGERGPVTIYTSASHRPIEAQVEALLEKNRDEVSDLLWWHLMSEDPRSSHVSAGRRQGSVVRELPAALPVDEAQ